VAAGREELVLSRDAGSVLYRGKPLDQMSKTELIEVVMELARLRSLCRNCQQTESEHCRCHKSCPGACPPLDSEDRVYRTFDAMVQMP